jgi:hypothetical protein
MIVKGGGVNMNPKTKYLLISLLVLIIGCSPVAVYADTNTTAKYDPYKLVPWDKIALIFDISESMGIPIVAFGEREGYNTVKS